MARPGAAARQRGEVSQLNAVGRQLQQAGLTPGGMRTRILDLMQSRTEPTTPEGLYRQLYDYCCVSTVYRTMAELHRANLLERYRLPSGKLAYSVMRRDGAPRLSCTRCGQVAFLQGEELKSGLRQACSLLGFSPESLELIGQCTKCAANPIRLHRD